MPILNILQLGRGRVIPVALPEQFQLLGFQNILHRSKPSYSIQLILPFLECSFFILDRLIGILQLASKTIAFLRSLYI